MQKGLQRMRIVENPTKVLYVTALGLFTAVFVASIALSVFDPEGTINEYRQLSFPEWLLVPQATAKALGLIALFQTRSQLLKDFAFAGFLYNLLLALGAHLSIGEAQVGLAIFGLVVWVFAFAMDRIYHKQQATA